MKTINTVFLVGPTASGKTDLGVSIAQKLNGEVVSADSMQIYKKMDIATAKPTITEMGNIKHHLIDFVEPNETYSVAKYKQNAMSAISDINDRQKIPIVVGGTGLYIDTLVNNIEFIDFDIDENMRQNLEIRAENEGVESLYNELLKIDPKTALKLHINNQKKIIHALEIYYQTGKTLSYQNENSRNNKSVLKPIMIGLTAKNRDYLYERINRRVDIMLEKGLISEMKEYYEKYSSKTSNQAIGYKEFLPYLYGNLSLEECKENLKKQTRHYAKRQLTWFRRYEFINWLYIDENSHEELLQKALDLIEGGNIE